jgi:hypothetical protein
MDKRKGYVLLLINAGIGSSVSERKKSRRLLHLACLSITVLLTYITRNSIQAGFACRQTFRSSNVMPI